MTSPNVARTPDGRFAGNNHAPEAAARDAKRYPTTAHDGGHSVGSHTGTMRGLGVATAAQQRKYERRAQRS
jgi:hypothetical protein